MVLRVDIIFNPLGPLDGWQDLLVAVLFSDFNWIFKIVINRSGIYNIIMLDCNTLSYLRCCTVLELSTKTACCDL